MFRKVKLVLKEELFSGQLRARSSRVFRLKGQSIDTPFNVETTIDFDDCEWHVEEHETLRLKVRTGYCFFFFLVCTVMSYLPLNTSKHPMSK